MKPTKKDLVNYVMDELLQGLYLALECKNQKKVKPGESYKYALDIHINASKEGAKILNRALNAWKNKYNSVS